MFGILLWISNKMKINKYLIFFLFSAKICASLFFLHIYIPDKEGEIKASDAHAYFFEGKVLNSVWDESPSDYLKLLTGIGSSEALEHKYLEEKVFHWSHRNKAYNDNENIIRLNSLIHFYSLNSPLIHAITLGFLSLIGFILIAVFTEKFSGVHNRLILITLVLLPSSLFWTSGILKEPVLVLGIGCALSIFLDIRKPIKIGLFSLGILLMLLFKPYILLFLTPGLIIAGMYYFLPTQNILVPISIALASLLVVFLIPDWREAIVFKTSKQQYDFNNISRGGVYFSHNNSIKHIDAEDLDKINFKDNGFHIESPVKVESVNYWDRMNVQHEYFMPSDTLYHSRMFPEKANGYFELEQFDSASKCFH